LSLTLSNPGGGTALGSQATAALNIADDEPASAASTDKTPPTLKLTVKKLQKALTAKRLVIKVRSNETATLAIKLRLRNGKTRTFVVIAKGSKKVAAAKAVTIKLTLSKKALAKLHAALANGRVKVRV